MQENKINTFFSQDEVIKNNLKYNPKLVALACKCLIGALVYPWNETACLRFFMETLDILRIVIRKILSLYLSSFRSF